jgi:hypothetical protein
MYLVSRHGDLIRSISLGIHVVIKIEVATRTVVVVYHFHNIFLDEDLVIYGGEGGRLNQANQLNVRVLANQQSSRRNLTMKRSIVV